MKNNIIKILFLFLVITGISCGGKNPVYLIYDKDDNVGFISAGGKVLVEPVYDKAGAMESGLIPVRKVISGDDGKEQHKWGYVNRSGKEAIPFEYDDATDFSENFAAVTKDKKCGYIDTQGNLVIPVEYNDCGSFSEGLASIKKDKLYGYIDNTGKIVIPFKFERAGEFENGLAPFSLKRKYGFIDTTGEVIIEPAYSKARSFKSGFAAVANKGKYGFVDSTGKEISNLEYDEVQDFSDGLAAVKQKKKWGFIDMSGALVIPLEYEEVFSFSEGLAAVRKERLWGYIDPVGKVVHEINHHGARPFVHGVGGIYTKEGKKIYVNKKLKEIYSFDIPRVGTYTRYVTDYAGWLSESFYVKHKEGGGYKVSYSVTKSNFGRKSTSYDSLNWTETDGVVNLRFHSNGITATGWFSPFGEYINFNRHEDDEKFFFRKRDRGYY